MAVTSLSSTHVAYQRTSQTQHTRSTTAYQGGGSGVAKGGTSAASAGDSVSVADPVAFANRVMQDKVASQLKEINAYLSETPGTKLIGEVDPAQVTPEGTAKFIVDMATSFISAYNENHKEEGDKEKLDGFMSLIKGGIEKGFQEARGILDALDVLKFGKVGENVDKTYDLVQKGLDDFYKTQLAAIESKGKDQGAAQTTEAANPSATANRGAAASTRGVGASSSNFGGS